MSETSCSRTVRFVPQSQNDMILIRPAWTLLLPQKDGEDENGDNEEEEEERRRICFCKSALYYSWNEIIQFVMREKLKRRILELTARIHKAQINRYRQFGASSRYNNYWIPTHQIIPQYHRIFVSLLAPSSSPPPASSSPVSNHDIPCGTVTLSPDFNGKRCLDDDGSGPTRTTTDPCNNPRLGQRKRRRGLNRGNNIEQEQEERRPRSYMYHYADTKTIRSARSA